MTLPVPDLDDRTFLDLVTQARERIQQSCPQWTDLSVHDPGMALVEAFAYLTEVMIYRLNQVPEKAYLSFLNLLGVSRHPPAAAFRSRPAPQWSHDERTVTTSKSSRSTRPVVTSRRSRRKASFWALRTSGRSSVTNTRRPLWRTSMVPFELSMPTVWLGRD